MPQPTQNLVGVLLPNYDGSQNSLYPTGNKPQPLNPITFTGANVGGEPTVVTAAYYMSSELGSRVPLNGWDATIDGSGENYRPKIFSLGSTRGAGTRSVTGANEMTGFIKTFTLSKTVFSAWQMGIPAGYYFSGASAVETLPPASNLKMIWFFDTAHGSDLNDIVMRSRNNPTTWYIGGNHAGSGDYAGSQVDWDSPMSFTCFRKPGANPYTDSGTSIAHQAFSTGAETHTTTGDPLFSKRTLLTFTVQNSALYTATINGTLCSYTSDDTATGSEIAVGLGADITAKGATWGGGCSVAGSNIEIIPDLGTVPTITVSANVTKRDALDGFGRFETVWQGNGNQVNTLHVYPYLYVAAGDYAGNCVVLTNSATFDATLTKFMAIPHSAWSAGVSCSAVPTDAMMVGMTHAHLFKDGVSVAYKTYNSSNDSWS